MDELGQVMSTAEVIYELVKTLPEEQAHQVLLFVESLPRNLGKQDTAPKLLADFLGILKDSPTFNRDPVDIQRAMRDDWE
jgi:uncharacterized membrane protein